MLGGGTAAIGTIFLTWLSFHLYGHPNVDRPDESNIILELASTILAFLIYILIGCLHGGLIGSLQGLLLLNKIPQNKQALHTAYKGSLVGLALFGILFNCTPLILVLLQRLSYLHDPETPQFVSSLILSFIFLSATISGLVQGLIQHRIARKRNSEIFRWCFFSIISCNLGLVLAFNTFINIARNFS